MCVPRISGFCCSSDPLSQLLLIRLRTTSGLADRRLVERISRVLLLAPPASNRVPLADKQKNQLHNVNRSSELYGAAELTVETVQSRAGNAAGRPYKVGPTFLAAEVPTRSGKQQPQQLRQRLISELSANNGNAEQPARLRVCLTVGRVISVCE